MQLSSIIYPVYKLPDDPIVENGVMYYYSEREGPEGPIPKLQIVDDTNIEGRTLAVRRLRLLAEGAALYKLSKAIFFLGDMIRLSNSSTTFIDSSGKLFKYKKDKFTKLKYHYIKQVIPVPTGGAILLLEGLPHRFKVLHHPHPNIKYAGVLHYNMQTILYGLYEEEPEKEGRRKI